MRFHCRTTTSLVRSSTDQGKGAPQPGLRPERSTHGSGDLGAARRFLGGTVGGIGLAWLLGACSNSIVSDGLAHVTPYRVEIVQGNVVTREQLDTVKPGMNREQVRGIFGSPLVADLFHANRWDYAFSLRRQGEVVQRKVVTAWFEGDVLKKVDAPSDMPSENEFVATLQTRRMASREAPKLELSDEERRALPAPVRTETPVVAPTGATRTYPPLEPTK